ncbi:MAG: tetraacyldisaccharide 4'-kinase [Cryomorphaceae bacterium]
MNQTRPWLLPFAWIYAAAVWIRNKCFDAGIFGSESPSGKTVVIGNLSLGGTGKTPHADYILSLLDPFKTALLSRGYGRQTKGFRTVTKNSNPFEVGDEPLLLASRHPEAVVAVCEDRLSGLAKLKKLFPEKELTVLDDAFQHRKLRGGLNILLTTWRLPFTDDYCLPAGSLRDHKVRARDAHAIVVTKTPKSATPAERAEKAAAMEYLKVPVFFSNIIEGRVVHFAGPGYASAESLPNILLVSAIADADLFEAEARKQFPVKGHFKYRDHHRFTGADLQRIRNFIGSFAPGSAGVLTTEKDAVRFMPLVKSAEFEKIPMYYKEIAVDFGSDTATFNKLITDYAQS